jgi:hypothetical protein
MFNVKKMSRYNKYVFPIFVFSYILHSLSWGVVDAIKQAIGSFVIFTFSTKFVCRLNQILTVIAVILIQNLCQAFMSKSHNLM